MNRIQAAVARVGDEMAAFVSGLGEGCRQWEPCLPRSIARRRCGVGVRHAATVLEARSELVLWSKRKPMSAAVNVTRSGQASAGRAGVAGEQEQGLVHAGGF
jgi:hypothetical protein